MGGRHSNAAKAQGAPGWKLIAAAVVAALIVGTGVLLWPRTPAASPPPATVAASASALTSAPVGSSRSASASTSSEPSTSSQASPAASSPIVSSASVTASSSTSPVTPVAAAAPAFVQDHPATQAGAGPCTQVQVLASLENADMVTAVAAAYSGRPRQVQGHCVSVVVQRRQSGVAAADAAAGFPTEHPSIWLPDSSSWLTVARAKGATAAVPGAGTSIARSPTVLAMPQNLLTAIGWDRKAPTWAQVVAASKDPKVWINLGHPEWGAFKFGKTSPLVATSGLDGLLASYGVAVGHLAGLTTSDIASPTARATVAAGEFSASHYMATPEHFMWHVRQADDAGSVASFLSGVIVDEKSVWDYNRGVTSKDGTTEIRSSAPGRKLVPVYPVDGVYEADNPAVPIDGSWVSPAQAAAARDVLRFLGSEQAQQVVKANGYRDIDGAAAPAVTAVGNFASTFVTVPLPTDDVVIAAQQSFPEVRKRARVLVVFDLSGSMSDLIAPGVTKLAAAKQAVTSSLGYFTGDDEVGLAAFSNYAKGAVEPGVVSSVDRWQQKNKEGLAAALGGLNPISETPLYAAIDQFTALMAGGYQADRVNAVVVLSDGRNDTTNPETLDQLTKKLSVLRNTTPTPVFTLAYGKDADAASLQKIADSSGGHFYDVTDPTRIGAVLADMVTSF